jgi:cadmium resistance protein CadD (predicted permease)
MKNFFKARLVPLFGIIALVAVIGFSMVACEKDDDGDSISGTYRLQSPFQGSGKVSGMTLTFSGDSYSLYIPSGSGSTTSTGTFAVNGGNVVLSGLGPMTIISSFTLRDSDGDTWSK